MKIMWHKIKLDAADLLCKFDMPADRKSKSVNMRAVLSQPVNIPKVFGGFA